MINYKYFNLFLENSIPKQVTVEFDGIALTNDDLYNQEMELEESLCSEEALRFGSCEASVLKFKISNIFLPMEGKWLDVKFKLDGNPGTIFPVGKYKVDSDKISADRRYREIVAYDAMHDILNADVSEWYDGLFQNNDGTILTMKKFRESFIRHFGLEESLPVIGKDGMGEPVYGLVNDWMVIEKTIQVGDGGDGSGQVVTEQGASLSGKDVATAICEVNGCFGHIGRDGKFHYIYLGQDIGGLYPSNDLFPGHAPGHLAQSKAGNLYPQDPSSYRVCASKYIECRYENFFTGRVTKLQIRNGENEIGKVYPEGGLSESDNCYVIEDNFLVYGKGDQQLHEIAGNIFEKITDIAYMPFNCDVIGNPCLEVGDAVRIPTKYDIVESYILKRTLKGVQALRDSIGADGVRRYVEKVNGVQSSIIQLKGKTNTLVRNVGETRSELTNFEKDTAGNFTDVRSSIVQTAENITSTVSAATSKYDTKNYKVGLFGYEDGEEIKYEASENNGKYYLNQGNGNLYLSNGESWELVEQLKLITENLSSEIKQTASEITSTISSAVEKYDTENYGVSLFGYATPPGIPYKASEHNGEYYLNQSDGKLYQSDGEAWVFIKDLSLITENLSSRIEQTVKSIKLEVKNGEKTAGISIMLENEDGSESELKGIIEMSDMVVFSDLSNEGKTTINGKNITTGEINCDLLNGGKINGQKIVGGEIEGSVVKAINGIHLQYLDSSTRPPTTKTYLFAKTGYDNPSEGGIPNHPFLNIYSPSGTPCILIGTGLYTENPDEFKFMDTPFFPNGAVVESAYIKSLQQTFKEEAELTGTSEGSSLGKLKILARASGSFVCVYGSYFTKTHMSGESVEFQISSIGSLRLPKHHSVRAVGNIGKRPFILTIGTDGVLSVRNIGVADLLSEDQLEMPFRFDYFRF